MSLITVFSPILSAEQISDEENVVDLPFDVLAGFAKPPYVIDDNIGGIQQVLMKEALAETKREFNFLHVPFGRTVTGYQQINADAILTIPPEYQHPSLFLSKPYIIYQNVAISLLEKNFTIDKIEDLAGKSIAAFQNAKKYLGDKYNQTVKSAMTYREIAKQDEQIDLLFMRRAEVIILDINIFKYYVKHKLSANAAKPFTVHYIFNERPYSAGFRDKNVQRLFDKNIQKMKASGSYQLILDSYLEQ